MTATKAAIAGILIILVVLLAVLLWRAGRRAFGGGVARIFGGTVPKKKPNRGPTRGEMVDEASKTIPATLIKAGLPEDWYGDFDLEGNEVVPPRPGEAIYFGLEARTDPGRATLLSAHFLNQIAELTSTRRYAWAVLDSPEGCYAVRATPDRGMRRTLDRDAFIGELRPLLTGSPPHKADREKYLSLVRRLGFIVVAGPPRDTVVRFDLINMTTFAEQRANYDRLAALTEADFAALDWTPYDKAVSACAGDHELAGDVLIEDGVVSVPKIRSGSSFSAHPHYRSYITFHTHPATRYRGTCAEPPSAADIRAGLWAADERGLVWMFVTAPEGTYIIRPGRTLAAIYKDDYRNTADRVIETYEASQRPGTTLASARQAVLALREAGLIAYFREHPCLPLSETPDAFAYLNRLEPAAYRESIERLKALPPKKLLTADWSGALEFGHSTDRLGGTVWFSADLIGGVVTRAEADSHPFEDPRELDSYPMHAPGPIMVFYGNVPGHIPEAAIEASRRRPVWAWLAFLDDRGVTVFRADGDKLIEASHKFTLARREPA